MLEELIYVAKQLMPDKKINWDNITSESSLHNDLGLDSIAFIMLSIGIEQQFGVEIPQAVGAKFVTVGDILKYIEENA